MDEDNEVRIVPREIVRKHNLSPRQTKIVGLFTLWIILAGLWKTGEAVIVILRWMFG